MIPILLLEDDSTLSKEISRFLDLSQFHCDCIYDGSLLGIQFKKKKYELVILDINVPGLNGLAVCKEIRAIDSKVLILMLTAFGEVEEKKTAYINGADDYLVKPFHFDELLIRIKSLLRRRDIPQLQANTISIGDLSIDFNGMSVNRNGIPIILSPKEFKLLTILSNGKGRIISKNQIASELWDDHIETNQNTIEVYINMLRKKIDKSFESKLIHTKIGFGYYLKQELD